MSAINQSIQRRVLSELGRGASFQILLLIQTKCLRDKTSTGQNVYRDKTSIGTKRLKGKNVYGTKHLQAKH